MSDIKNHDMFLGNDKCIEDILSKNRKAEITALPINMFVIVNIRSTNPLSKANIEQIKFCIEKKLEELKIDYEQVENNDMLKYMFVSRATYTHYVFYKKMENIINNINKNLFDGCNLEFLVTHPCIYDLEVMDQQ